ncbi:MAG: hypothetical protein N3B18_01050, partial [Desulfobacterota bacterium]|nr:hypothetical protein [Thermodesulfobacteriota bacterium]
KNTLFVFYVYHRGMTRAMLFVTNFELMKKSAVLWCCLILVSGCVSVREREIRLYARTYPQPYDKVWDAVEDILLRDFKCTIKGRDKKRGKIETEWVHVFDTDGTKRWMVQAQLKKHSNGVTVIVDRRVELRDEPSRTISRYRREKKDTNEPTASAWKRTDVDREAIEDIYRKIDVKLAR